MHSIQTRITALTVLAVLITALVFGGAAVWSSKLGSDRNSVEKLDLLCGDRKKTIDAYLNSIRQSVETVSRYTDESLDSAPLAEGGVDVSPEERTPQQQETLDRCLTAHVADVERVFRSVASHTSGVSTYYYRLSPEVSLTVPGFFYAREEGDEFRYISPMDITAYDAADAENVGWYYFPVMQGRPVWRDPYLSGELNVRMISYSTPVCEAGTCVGVIGMEILYDTLVSQINELRVYDTGFAWLADAEGRIIYHPFYGTDRNMADIEPQLESTVALLKQENSGGEMLRYRHSSGQERQLSFTTLSNGMKLFVAAPVSEINAGWTRLLSIFFVVAVLLLAVFTAAMLLVSRRIVKPLQLLTTASKRLAAGDYDVDLDYSRNDEVGVLTGSFQQMRDRMKALITDLNSRANTDSLTGIRNKSAYDVFAARLDEQIAQAGEDDPPAFAIVMFDCNSLKEINDAYGHDNGDIYLQTVCRMICRVFAHSAVFRLGGDEFAAVLQNADYEDREALLVRYDREVAALNSSVTDPWDRVDAAKGMSEFRPGEDSGSAVVLQRADDLMYEEKRRLKAAGMS